MLGQAGKNHNEKMVKLLKAVVLANVAVHVMGRSTSMGAWGVPSQSTKLSGVESVISIAAGGDSSSIESAKSAAIQSAAEKVGFSPSLLLILASAAFSRCNVNSRTILTS